jgi:hypothetical protein
MDKNTSSPLDESSHQTVAEFIKLKTSQETIKLGFTDQKVSGRAGLLTFAGFLHWHRLGDLLAKLLPHRPKSKKAIPPQDLALGFIAGILAGAVKLTHVAHLRNNVMLPALLAIQKIGSQSSFTRFFQGFKSGAANLWSTTIILRHQRQLKTSIESGRFFICFVSLLSVCFQPPWWNGAFGA